ncbi:MAG: hypothetical protein ACYTG0_18585 [Planctomycetota bacterium]
MPRLFETVTDFAAGAEALRRRAHGVVEASGGTFRRVLLRPVPKLVSLPGVFFWGRWVHRRRRSDRCLLYYSQPRRFPDFLAVTYFASGRGTTLASVLRTLEALDEIARLKQSDALLCHMTNPRISARVMSRWGWEPHCESRGHGHYIKRFYGSHPPSAGWIEGAQALAAV